MTPEEPASSLEAIRTAPSVVRWFDSARLHSDPEEEKQLRYGLLAAFCDHMGQSPDELDQETLDGLRVPTTTAELDMAPVQIYWFADLSYADPNNFRKNLKELVSLGALNPSHGWSDAYVDENVVGQIITPMLSDPQVVGWMGTIETGLALNQAMLAAVDEGLGVCLHAVNFETAKQVFKYPDHWIPCWTLLVGYPAEDPLTGGQRPRRSISTMAYVNNLDTPWEEDPAVTEKLKAAGLIQDPIDPEKRAAEVRQLARRFGLPE